MTIENVERVLGYLSDAIKNREDGKDFLPYFKVFRAQHEALLQKDDEISQATDYVKRFRRS